MDLSRTSLSSSRGCWYLQSPSGLKDDNESPGHCRQSLDHADLYKKILDMWKWTLQHSTSHRSQAQWETEDHNKVVLKWAFPQDGNADISFNHLWFPQSPWWERIEGTYQELLKETEQCLNRFYWCLRVLNVAHSNFCHYFFVMNYLVKETSKLVTAQGQKKVRMSIFYKIKG